MREEWLCMCIVQLRKSETGQEDSNNALDSFFALCCSAEGRIDDGVLTISSVLPVAGGAHVWSAALLLQHASYNILVGFVERY